MDWKVASPILHADSLKSIYTDHNNAWDNNAHSQISKKAFLNNFNDGVTQEVTLYITFPQMICLLAASIFQCHEIIGS